MFQTFQRFGLRGWSVGVLESVNALSLRTLGARGTCRTFAARTTLATLTLGTFGTLGTLGTFGNVLAQVSQPPIRILNPTNPNPNPGDARMHQFEDAKGASWRVFAVDSLPEAPVAIAQVGEVKQHNPPSTWSVHVVNHALLPATSVTVAAAVVDVNGNIKAIQPLPAIKDLKPSQVQRRETRIRVTVIAPTDRVVFYLRELMSEAGDWKASESDVAVLIRTAAQRLPVP
jgi:hypothetical protein